MKESNLSFADGFLGIQAEIARNKNATIKAFNFDMAANIIKERLKDHLDLIAEAGLEGDWNYTGGEIFKNGFPTNDSYTYLSSNWAIPTLILSWNGIEQESFECYVEKNERFHSDSKWDQQSLSILGINMPNKLLK